MNHSLKIKKYINSLVKNIFFEMYHSDPSKPAKFNKKRLTSLICPRKNSYAFKRLKLSQADFTYLKNNLSDIIEEINDTITNFFNEKRDLYLDGMSTIVSAVDINKQYAPKKKKIVVKKQPTIAKRRPATKMAKPLPVPVYNTVIPYTPTQSYTPGYLECGCEEYDCWCDEE